MTKFEVEESGREIVGMITHAQAAEASKSFVRGLLSGMSFIAVIVLLFGVGLQCLGWRLVPPPSLPSGNHADSPAGDPRDPITFGPTPITSGPPPVPFIRPAPGDPGTAK